MASVEVSRSTEVSDYGTVEATLKDGSIIIVEAPSMSTLQAKLDQKAAENGFRLEVGELQRESLFTTILSTLLPIILMVIVFTFLFNRMNGGGSKMNNFGKSKAKMSVDGEKYRTALITSARKNFAITLPALETEFVNDILKHISTDTLENLCYSLEKQARKMLPPVSQLYTEENNNTNSNNEFKF